MVSKIHRTEAGVTRFGHVLAEVVALDTVAAKLRFPAAYFKPDLVLTGSVGNAQTPGGSPPVGDVRHPQREPPSV